MGRLIGTALLFAASLATQGCAIGARLGWTGTHAVPTDIVQANCESDVRTLKGRSDHATALGACIDAKTRQGVR